MTDLLPCPICHNNDVHKLDCQNATYVCSLLRRIRELENKIENQQGWVSVWRKRVDVAETKLEQVRKLPDKWRKIPVALMPEDMADELEEVLAGE